MTWEEMIQIRREKESLVVSPFEIKIACHKYQLEVERAFYRLTYLERRAMVLRFIEPHPIARIADLLGMSWDGADQLIDRTVDKIRKIFLENQFHQIGGAA